MMIRDFKTRIFCQENQLSRREVDASDRIWTARVDEFFRQRDILPPPNDPLEYAAAFEAIFPLEAQRRQYIADKIALGNPSFGHRVFGALLSAGRIPCIFTTNFDPLIEQASNSAVQLLPTESRSLLTVAAIDSADRAIRAMGESDWPLLVKIHGDYQSLKIKNTGSELEVQDSKMRRVLTSACERFGLVVVGYSGRDFSVMEALEEALKSPDRFPSGLYWINGTPDNMLPAVKQLLDKATAAGVPTSVVKVPTFDELAADVIRDFVDLPAEMLKHVMEAQKPAALAPINPPTTPARKYPVLRFSALLVEQLPLCARKIELETPSTTASIRTLLKEANVRAVVACNGREVAAFGNDQKLLHALEPLGPKLSGTITLRPERDSWALGLLYDALVRTLSRKRPLTQRLRNTGHALLVASDRPNEPSENIAQRAHVLSALRKAYDAPLTGNVPILKLPYAEGINVRLDRFNEMWWLGFDPFTFVDVPHDKKTAQSTDDANIHQPYRGDPAGDWRRERWARKYNGNWAAIIDAWAKLLVADPEISLTALGVPSAEGVDAHFKLSPTTAWSSPSHHHAYFERTQ
ncbi:SIR2 family protein [Pseudomonas sp. S2.OTC.A_B10]|uniref:SIR2 family protein n=1 Tax=Pseudomonas sp. S2.OTC.A_B10 TaxID=3237018 RepID=UPI003CF79B79